MAFLRMVIDSGRLILDGNDVVEFTLKDGVLHLVE
jgi:hypothetical protein